MGLKVLLKSIGYPKVDSGCISFGIAPRINACGRMGHQEEALKLFFTENIEEAQKIATSLNEYNKERQDKEKKIFEEANIMIKQEGNDKSCIILAGENWHHGVIGIVSSKVTDMYYKPSILICLEGDIGKGSGRSIPGFDMHNALTTCNSHIEKFGGHAMAIGITVKKDEFPLFKKELEEYAKKCNIDKIVPIIKIDEEVSLRNIGIEDIKEISLLEPFGESNKKPLFVLKNLKILSIRSVSEGKHLKLTLKDDNYFIDAIGFNMGEYADEYLIGNKVDVVGTLEVNNYNNYETIQINLKDIRNHIN